MSMSVPYRQQVAIGTEGQEPKPTRPRKSRCCGAPVPASQRTVTSEPIHLVTGLRLRVSREQQCCRGERRLRLPEVRPVWRQVAFHRFAQGALMAPLVGEGDLQQGLQLKIRIFGGKFYKNSAICLT